MKAPFIRSPYNYDREAASDESGLDCSVEPTLTKQAFADEADINVLVRRFGLDNPLPSGARAPTYGDFTGISDYHTAVNAIAVAHEAFDELPAAVRARFHNDPALLVDFCSNEGNRAEAEKLGLVMPQAPVPAGVGAFPAPAPVVPPTDKPPAAPAASPPVGGGPASQGG